MMFRTEEYILNPGIVTRVKPGDYGSKRQLMVLTT